MEFHGNKHKGFLLKTLPTEVYGTSASVYLLPKEMVQNQ